jgi:hypothetical protein
MSKLYIRVKKDGFIYDYNEILAKNPGCEVVTEEVAFPERFIPAHAKERVEEFKKTKGARKKSTLDLTTENIPESPPYTPPELAEEAARGMP